MIRPCCLLFFAGALSGCLCPPCPESADAAPLVVGARLSLWNGDGDNQGSSPKGWESCDAEPCTSKVAPQPSVGKDASNGLVFQAEGAQWIGGGWNLFGWYPADAGIDISRYDTLQFWLRVQAESTSLAPAELSVGLGGSGDNNSAFAPVSRVDKKFNDGEWHLIEIPLSDLQKGEGKNFNPQSVWEFRINTWNAVPKKFTAFVDDIAVVKTR
jgi:hypothetical protein